MKWFAALALLVVVSLAAYWGFLRGGPPTVPFAKVSRERLTSTLSTNGKIEPSEWAVVRAPMAGRLAALPITKGASVRKGQIIGRMEGDAARAEVVAAEARLEQARADLASAMRGGATAPAVAELEGALERARPAADRALPTR